MKRVDPNKEITIDKKTGRVRVRTINNEPSMTQQHHKDLCDVNKIIAKAKNGLPVTHLAKTQGQFMDVASIPQYDEALQVVVKANESFMSLPAHVRKEFGNDPQTMLEFLSDEKNRERAEKLGLLKPKEKPEPTSAPAPKEG